jgi:hypothetical protein
MSITDGASIAVAAVPNPGYAFTNWSDGLTVNPRTDANVTSNLTVTANFVMSVNTTPANVAVQVSGAALDVSWPADRIGWELQAQTNNLNTGLGARWSPWPGSTATNRALVPVVATNPAVFLRLVYPPQP